MPTFTIRNASKADIDGLTRLEAASFDSDRLSARSFRRLVDSRAAACRVAANAGALAGYHLLFFRAGSDIARLYSIAVDPAWRRAGLAKGLLADAERTARKRRCRRLRLEVRADNPLAVRLYERQGYRSIGRRPEYYADRADALLYEKQLGARTDEDRSPRDSDRRSAYIEPVQGAKPAVPRNAAPNVPPHAEPLPPPR